MYVDFTRLPQSARVWVYQADRPLTPDEEARLLAECREFAATWTAHQQALQASAQVRHGQFLILAVDEAATQASGCSIDKSVHFVQSLQARYGIGFLDRSRQAFLLDGAVRLLPLPELKAAVAAGQITPDTLAFDNTVSTLAQLEGQWLRPAAGTWLSRHFKAVAS